MNTLNMIEEEEWKPITDFENYEISSNGRVRMYIRKNKYLILNITKPSRKTVFTNIILTKDDKEYTRLIHRLIAIEFISNPNNKSYVYHKDGDKFNNSVNNLMWINPKELKKLK